MNARQDAPDSLAIEARRVFDGERMLGARRVEIVAGRIAAIRDAGRSDEALKTVRLDDDAVLAPGFIDIQVNGGGDVLLNDDPSVASVERIARAHRKFGTTGLLPTLITDHPDKLARLAACAAEAMRIPGVLGFHLEGPHLNPARKGIHPPEHIRPMTEPDRRRLTEFARHGRSMVTLAPELTGVAAVAELSASGLRVAAGHSEATAGEAAAAAERGLTGVTHLFNAMSQMGPREPGLVGAALADDRLFAGIIPDGIHVAPLNLKAAFRAIGRDRLVIVTDAMPTSAGHRGFFHLQGRRIGLDDGRLTDVHGTLAGAHLTMNEAVRNAVAMMGASLEDALVMASQTPARFLGLERELGRIAPGYRADLVAFDADLAILESWIGGAPDGA